jgi:hypothetical protein
MSGILVQGPLLLFNEYLLLLRPLITTIISFAGI